jgi:allophanate hydrolase
MTVALADLSLDIATLSAAYRSGNCTPLDLAAEISRRIAAAPALNVWISRLDDAAIAQYARVLVQRRPDSLPLYGIPFAVKDNIDLVALPTTAACPAFAYQPKSSAYAVQRLIDAGAIPIGKTNLDQFATGLVGTRSPYGVCHNSIDPEFISGGSSSGSAVAVATGLVSFALGTDTAGSGRIPAAFNNLIGYKPTCGLISPRGMVPACRTLDAISVFALTAEDAAQVGNVAAHFDSAEPYSRAAPAAAAQERHPWQSGQPFRFAVPEQSQLQFFGNENYANTFAHTVDELQQLGGIRVAIDFEPFIATARLLYEGPWLAERQVALGDLLVQHPDALHPVTRQIICNGAQYTAADAFRASYKLMELRRRCEKIWQQCDVLVTPTAGTTYRIAEVSAEPLKLNSNLGYYTNFVNLLDLAAVAVPAGFTPARLPFGITLLAPAWSDAMLLRLAALVQRALNQTLGALPHSIPETVITMPPDQSFIDVAVCGAHLEGLPLNHQLTERGATLRLKTRTAPRYRFYALPGGPPFRPGLVQVGAGGVAIDVEVWSVPQQNFGAFVAGIPAPLGIGKVTLTDGSQVSGFVCEHYAVDGAEDISQLGSWRSFLARPKQ